MDDAIISFVQELGFLGHAGLKDCARSLGINTSTKRGGYKRKEVFMKEITEHIASTEWQTYDNVHAYIRDAQKELNKKSLDSITMKAKRYGLNIYKSGEHTRKTKDQLSKEIEEVEVSEGIETAEKIGELMKLKLTNLQKLAREKGVRAVRQYKKRELAQEVVKRID